MWLYGVAEAINYGLGSLMAFLGGLAGDRFGRRRMAVLGNAIIISVSLLGFARYWWQALLIFMVGWWFRNFRTPPRRAMMTEVTDPGERNEAFGILHALDIAGAALSITYTAILLFVKFPGGVPTPNNGGATGGVDPSHSPSQRWASCQRRFSLIHGVEGVG